jgi:hypothetical protein
MHKGAVFLNFIQEIQKSIDASRKINSLKPLAEKLSEVLNRLSEVAMHLGQKAMSPEFKNAFAHAHPFLEVIGDVTMAWMHLWRSTAAYLALEKIVDVDNVKALEEKVAANKEAAFYDGQIKTAEFFYYTILPVTMGKMNAIDETHHG